jgi:hypothetical protein
MHFFWFGLFEIFILLDTKRIHTLEKATSHSQISSGIDKAEGAHTVFLLLEIFTKYCVI